MNADEKIKDTYSISFNLADISEEDRYPMNDWYNDLINKTYNQLNLFDITRMIIQKIFLELAVSKSLIFIKENPFCGQRYEGELLELLTKLDISHLEDYRDDIKEILLKAVAENKNYDWLCEEERDEFFNLINSFKDNLNP